MADTENNVIEEDFLTRIEIVVDGETRRWLVEVANSLHASPALVAASLLKDIVRDDLEAHDEIIPAVDLRHLN